MESNAKILSSSQAYNEEHQLLVSLNIGFTDSSLLYLQKENLPYLQIVLDLCYSL